MTSRKNFLLGFFVMTLLIFFSRSEVDATLPSGPELPMEASYTVMTLEESGGKPGGRFEYDISFTALFDLEKAELYFTKPEEVIFDAPPQPFHGSMKAGETKTWKLKGSITGMIRFEDGNVLRPPIRFEGSYLYPYEAVREEILRRFQKGEGIPYARNQEDALKEMDDRQLKGKTIKVFKGWPA